MTKLYLIRHGETELNKQGCYYGWTDCSLAEAGKRQAEALERVFQNIEYDVMLSSDLKRAVETANIINTKSQGIIIDHRLRELNLGKWEGKFYQEIMEQYPEHWEIWVKDWMQAAPTGGESIAEMHKRIVQCLDEVLEKYKDKNVVIISHNGALRIIAAYLIGLPLDDIWHFCFEQGRYNLLEIDEGYCVIKYINNI